MSRSTPRIAEDCMLAVLAGLGLAGVAAVQIAGALEPPVPTPCRLEQIAADRAHRPELGRCSQRARFAERLRDLGLDLELSECRPRSDPRPVDSARDDVTDLEQ